MKKSSTEDNEKQRFSAALGAAMIREKGVHGSVGTQNEKLIHATLKNYYAPFSDEQEIKIGNYFADAASSDGIFEIQTRALYRLSDKLRAFLDCAKTTVVHPIIGEYKTLFINEQSGEIVKETAPRKMRSLLSVFEELYSIRGLLREENLTVIVVRLKIEKRVYFSGETLPDMKNKFARKKCVIEKIPLEILEEIKLEIPRDYARFLPENLPARFTKKELCKAAGEARSSLRTEVLRETGIIKKIGQNGREFLYEIDL